MAMAPEDREQSVAILIDFENAKDADLNRVLAEGARFGRVIVRRAYADWTKFPGHAARLREAGFEEVHQFASGGRGKNATDIYLVVDAMDLLYTRPVNTFVLVTADSDFAKLARRLREGGKRIIGMGARGRVGRALVQSCDEYVYYDTSPPKRVREDHAPAPGASAATPTPPAVTGDTEKAAAEAPKPVALGELHYLVVDAMDAAEDKQGKVYGGPLHEAIRRIRPDFNYRDFGYSSFLKMIESLAPVIRSKHAENVSDFVVWIDPDYEDVVMEARDAARPSESTTSGSGTGGGGGPNVLADDVQKHLLNKWLDIAGGHKKLSGRRAAEIVSHEYGVTRLADTPLGSLDGVLDAAPMLKQRWKREGAWLVPKK